ncbi:Hypothetical predicted protein [Mytilus galloprovincialis]|uniref:Uncharacterized protein n=1 Tax=Mytilus galloprovincialis TaxID=29158 RepID=A0A8B6G9D6_MYTGA|nr:Hypothetical predicted protein [Mytilus galloprovincialis]
MEQNNEIEKTINKLGLLESLGEVTVVKTHIAIKRELDVKSEAQVESRERTNITVMTMNTKTKIKINIGEWIRNMTCLMDGSVNLQAFQIKFTQGNSTKSDITKLERLQLQQSSQTDTRTAKRVASAANLSTCIEPYQSTVTAATHFLLEHYSRQLLALEYRSIERQLVSTNLPKTQELLLVKPLEKNEKTTVKCAIKILGREWEIGENWKKHQQRETSPYTLKPRPIGHAPSQIVGNSLSKITPSEDLTGPRGLCTDTYGNIIVADGKSRRLIVISKNGQGSKVLINEEDGLMFPQCISKHNESSGFIGDYLDKYLVKFNLSYE